MSVRQDPQKAVPYRGYALTTRPRQEQIEWVREDAVIEVLYCVGEK